MKLSKKAYNKSLLLIIALLFIASITSSFIHTDYIVRYEIISKGKVISTDNIFIANNPDRNRMYNRVKHYAKCIDKRTTDIHILEMGYK